MVLGVRTYIGASKVRCIPFSQSFRFLSTAPTAWHSKNMDESKVQQPEWHAPKNRQPAAELKLYNTLTRTKTPFVPINGKEVTWYSCGPTVYDAAHMGHARNYVTTDINRRLLQDYFGYDVLFVQNVTDIDDKIIVRARQNYLFGQFRRENASDIEKIKPKLKLAVERYATENLVGFSGPIDNFNEWLQTIDVSEATVSSPKLPMHITAVKGGIEALSLDDATIFFEKAKSVLVPVLDEEKGASVTDPKVFRELPSYWEQGFDNDMRSLNVLPPTVTTRVSEFIPEIVIFVEKIIGQGFAYPTEDGSVYFDTVAFEKGGHVYAKLQPWNKGKQELIDEGEGSLSLKLQGKKSKNDFALWKASKPGEPLWDSPWGQGRPGWHIECSVMASQLLGEEIDIHSGGIDLAFPHHDNELAQAEACHGNKQWVNYFMHTGHLHIEGQKMSKSLKNFISIEEALKRYSPRQLRLAFALQQWNSQFDFKSSLSEVKALESSLTNYFRNVKAFLHEEASQINAGAIVSKKVSELEIELLGGLRSTKVQVHNAFADNLAVPIALQAIADLVQQANGYISNRKADIKTEILADIAKWITKILRILGFSTSEGGIGWASENADVAGSIELVALPYVQALSRFRDEVRSNAIAKAPYSQFLAATDRLRNDELLELNVSLDDRTDGQPALVKFIDEAEKKELIAQRDEKLQKEIEKQAKKAEQAKIEQAKEQERLEKAKVSHKDMFKNLKEYSTFDDEGVPLTDNEGNPLSKSLSKKLAKLHAAQKKLHEDYLNGRL
jgi:cysteinyl-tRNA synthetase